MRVLLLIFLMSLSIIPAYSQSPTVGDYAAAPDEWLLSTGQKWHYHTGIAKEAQRLVEREPFDDEIAIVERAKKILNSSSAKAILLMDGNQIVWQGYKSPANSKSLFLSFSIGKTVTSMAIGKAICSGKLSLTDISGTLIPELQHTDLGQANVQQLLKMSSGTAAVNHDSSIMSTEQESEMRLGKISLLDILNTPKVSSAIREMDGTKHRSGEVFDYHSTDPLLLGILLNKVTAMPYAKWVEEQVLIPAGISHEAIIGQDHFGYGQADGNVRLTLEDWGRFAFWVKRNENGKGCFANYIKHASSTQITNEIKREGKSFDGYGYLIWTENNKKRDSYWAVGYGGQRIGWNHSNQRILIAFSNIENYMDDLYLLYRDWSSLPN